MGLDETACRSGVHVHGGFGTGASNRPRMPTLGTHCAAGVEIEVEVLRPLLLRMGLLWGGEPTSALFFYFSCFMNRGFMNPHDGAASTSDCAASDCRTKSDCASSLA